MVWKEEEKQRELGAKNLRDRGPHGQTHVHNEFQRQLWAHDYVC